MEIDPETFEEEGREVVFKPNPGPQTLFLASSEREVLYGGAAGGGKSYAILADAIRNIDHPSYKGLILRRTTEELRELIAKSQELYPAIYPRIKWSQRAMEWKLPNGGSLWMSYLDRDQDVTKYQGQSFTYIAFDELTQWSTPYAWNYLRSRLRSADMDYVKTRGLYQRATTNPGGIGHAWVKKMFVDPAPWGKAFWATDVETGRPLVYPEKRSVRGVWEKHPKAGQPIFKRKFIPAYLSDNPYLFTDGDYEAMLLSLPEHEKKRLLEGNWDVMEGAAFPEWNREIHVIPPFEIPTNWRRFRACDYGYGSYSAVLWFAIAPDEQLIVYRELYVSKVLGTDLADMILELEKDDGLISYGMLDRNVWSKKGETGVSIAEQMISRGCRWRPADQSKGSRVNGKNEVHRRLQVDEFTGEPRIVFFNTCTNTIAQLPVLPLDPDNPEDVYTKAEDHIYDALRYGCMSRPRSNLWDFDNTMGSSYRPADLTFGY